MLILPQMAVEKGRRRPRGIPHSDEEVMGIFQIRLALCSKRQRKNLILATYAALRKIRSKGIAAGGFRKSDVLALIFHFARRGWAEIGGRGSLIVFLAETKCARFQGGKTIRRAVGNQTPRPRWQYWFLSVGRHPAETIFQLHPVDS